MEKCNRWRLKNFEEKGYAITYGELTLEGLKIIMNKVDSKKGKVFVDKNKILRY